MALGSPFITSDKLPHSVSRYPGLRVLYFDGKTLYGSRQTKILKSEDLGKTWSLIARVALPRYLQVCSYSRPFQRLTRSEVFRLQPCKDKLVALAKGGVYIGSEREGVLHLSFRVTKGSRHISLVVTPNNRVYFGEYHNIPDGEPIRIYGSSDIEKWSVVYEFGAGEIQHVHNIIYDRFEECLWILTGDVGKAAGILRASLDFSEVKWVCRGSQDFRVVSMICLPTGLLFGTDTETEANSFFFMERESKTPRKLRSAESSVFFSGQFGRWAFFSTGAEPSAVNESKQVHVWGTSDLQHWHRLATFRKDRFPHLFQFGSVYFPEGKTENLKDILFSGNAIAGADNVTYSVPLADFEEWARSSPATD